MLAMVNWSLLAPSAAPTANSLHSTAQEELRVLWVSMLLYLVEITHKRARVVVEHLEGKNHEDDDEDDELRVVVSCV